MNWHNWLFILCFIAVSAFGLRLSWLWTYRLKYQRWHKRSRLLAKTGQFSRSKRHVYYVPHR